MNSPARTISGNTPTLEGAVRQTAKKLRIANISHSEQQARALVCHVTGAGSVELVTQHSRQLDAGQVEILRQVVERRLAGESVGRIAGAREFYGLELAISTDTLEPRADSETLVDAVLKDANDHSEKNIRMLDIGTGSGALIISLLKNLPRATGIASDNCDGALVTAKQNAVRNGVEKRVSFVNTNWSEGIDERFDVIVSNPPYIRTGVIATLGDEVKNHDPHSALDGGRDGLDAYRQIFTQCSCKLARLGRLYLEIGYDQADAVRALARDAGWRFVRLEKDFGGNDRVIVFQKQ